MMSNGSDCSIDSWVSYSPLVSDDNDDTLSEPADIVLTSEQKWGLLANRLLVVDGIGEVTSLRGILAIFDGPLTPVMSASVVDAATAVQVGLGLVAGSVEHTLVGQTINGARDLLNRHIICMVDYTSKDVVRQAWATAFQRQPLSRNNEAQMFLSYAKITQSAETPGAFPSRNCPARRNRGSKRRRLQPEEPQDTATQTPHAQDTSNAATQTRSSNAATTRSRRAIDALSTIPLNEPLSIPLPPPYGYHSGFGHGASYGYFHPPANYGYLPYGSWAAPTHHQMHMPPHTNQFPEGWW